MRKMASNKKRLVTALVVFAYSFLAILPTHMHVYCKDAGTASHHHYTDVQFNYFEKSHSHSHQHHPLNAQPEQHHSHHQHGQHHPHVHAHNGSELVADLILDVLDLSLDDLLVSQDNVSKAPDKAASIGFFVPFLLLLLPVISARANFLVLVKQRVRPRAHYFIPPKQAPPA